jgi:hypothetical protein
VQSIPLSNWFQDADPLEPDTSMSAPRSNPEGKGAKDSEQGIEENTRSFEKDGELGALAVDPQSARYSVAGLGAPLTYAGQKKAISNGVNTAIYVILTQPQPGIIEGRPKKDGESWNLYAVDKCYILSIDKFQQDKIRRISHLGCGIVGCTGSSDGTTTVELSPRSHLHPFLSQISKSRPDYLHCRHGYKVSRTSSFDSDEEASAFDAEAGIVMIEKQKVTEVIWYS